MTKCKALRDTLCSVALSEAQPTDDLNSACCAASFIFLLLYSSFYLHLATSEMSCWSRGRGILTELSLCCSSVYHYNGAQRYEQFLRVSRLDRALIFLDLAPYYPSASVSSIFMVLYTIHSNFLVTSFYLPVSELSLVGLAIYLVD